MFIRSISFYFFLFIFRKSETFFKYSSTTDVNYDHDFAIDGQNNPTQKQEKN